MHLKMEWVFVLSFIVVTNAFQGFVRICNKAQICGPQVAQRCKQSHNLHHADCLVRSSTNNPEDEISRSRSSDKRDPPEHFGNSLDMELLEEVLLELEVYDSTIDFLNDQSLADVFGDDNVETNDESFRQQSSIAPSKANYAAFQESATRDLENALMQGVVPVSAGVGSDSLPGDFGFDPLGLADRDMFRPTQLFLLQLLPESRWSDNDAVDLKVDGPRPKALVLRDYREAEIRHGRLAMLAAVIWPLQEMLDRFILPQHKSGPLLLSSVTLPYFPLLMTAIMLLLGYLDIYSQAIKDAEQIGEAFLPGDCFWDPLKILDGTSNRTKRNMQERELFNGRAAMVAFASFVIEELATKQALIDIESNALLLRPVYQVPFVQEWLDQQFTIQGNVAVLETLISL